MILTDGAVSYHITVRMDGSVELAQPTDVQVFADWWKREARLRDVACHFDGSDYGIAKRLLNQHGIDSLKERGMMFWRRHSGPLHSGEYDRHMVLFSSKIQEIEHDLSTRLTE